MKNMVEMFPRAELKQRAKEKMRGHWGSIFAVTLLYMIAGALFAGAYFTVSGSGSLMSSDLMMNSQLVAKTLVISFVVSIVGALLIDGVLVFCYTAWFVKLANQSENGSFSFGDFVEGFSDAVRGILVYIWKSIWEALWGLLAVPGYVVLIIGIFQESFVVGLIGFALLLVGFVVAIIRILRYTFAFHVVADCQSKISVRRALRHSITMTEGYVGAIFVMSLSFIPWFLLSAVTFGLATFYVLPYVTASFAMAYKWLRDKAFRENRLSAEEFGYMSIVEQVEVPQAPTTEVVAPVEAEKEVE